MLFNMRRILVVVVFSAIAGACSFVWAAHGHGGGHGGHGHSHSGGHGHGGGSFHSGGHGFSGGHGHVSHGHFGGHRGFNNHWGGGTRYFSGYSSYHHHHGWPYSYYRNYYRPYSYSYAYLGYPFLYGLYGYGGYPTSYYYGYPSYYYSYPSDYCVNDDDYYYRDALPRRDYVVSRPVADVAQVQFRLPDPQATIWVQGKEMTSSGTVRQFSSPQLDPSQQYTYQVKAEWNDNGKVISDERQVKVQANALAVVDFTRPAQVASDADRPALPDLPPPQPRPANELR